MFFHLLLFFYSDLCVHGWKPRRNQAETALHGIGTVLRPSLADLPAYATLGDQSQPRGSKYLLAQHWGEIRCDNDAANLLQIAARRLKMHVVACLLFENGRYMLCCGIDRSSNVASTANGYSARGRYLIPRHG